jgi:ABC-type Fe3+/spermidine/putrescine transport system ATPase subunit
MAYLEVRDLRKVYPDGWTLADVNLDVAAGENLCLLGPSGSGKTTLLRLIAGLELPDRGSIHVAGREVTGVPVHQRGFGLMFQEYALFPHHNVYDNVAFGLRMQRQPRAVVRARVAEVLALVGMTGFEARDVNLLSGGERQRVALARALAPRPALLMLDEPLGALDRAMRERLMEELPRILRRAGVTAITVTHDQEEAFAIADRIALLRDGRIVQVGGPEQVYCCPASAWVARFLGLSNLLPARVAGPGQVLTPLGLLAVDGAIPADERIALQLLVRPEAARLDDPGRNRLHGVVVERSFRGSHYRLGVRHTSGVELTFHLPLSTAPPEVGAELLFTLDPQALTLLPAET